jgi:hypothetical protein
MGGDLRDAASIDKPTRSHPGTALALSLHVTDLAQLRDVVRVAQKYFGA